jgi:hypothetical protein
VFDFVDEALDAIAQLVGFFIIRDSWDAAGAWRNDSIGLSLDEIGAKPISVIGFIGDDADERQILNEPGCLGYFVDLACGEDQAQRMTEGIDSDMDFGTQAAARAADRLILSPPFAPALCWCARTMVASIMTCSKSGSLANSLNRRSHKPFLAHRLKRT